MVKVEPQVLGKKDERLEYLLAQVKEGIKMFVEAIHKSSDEHETIGFKIFTLKTERTEEASAIFDVIMSAVAIELNEQAQDLIKKFTFFHQQETPVDNEHSLILFCRKIAPPTKEEIDKKYEEEVRANTVIQDNRTVNEIIEGAEAS